MTDFWKDFRVIWNCTVRYGVPRWSVFGCACLFVVGLLLTASIGWYTGNWPKSIGAGGSPLAGVLVLLWSLVVSRAVKQASPANAKLVPRLRSRIVLMVVLTGMACTVLASIIYGQFSGKFAWSFIACGFYLLGIAWAQVSVIGVLCLLLPSAFSLSENYLLPPIKALLWSDQALFVAAVALILMSAYFIRTMFPRGGDRNWKVQGRLLLSEQARKSSWGASFNSEGFAARPYGALLRRDCNKRSRNLVLHVLGPSSHWSVLLRMGAVAVLCVLMGKAWLLLFPHPALQSFLSETAWILASMLMLGQCIVCGDPVSRMAATSTEQSLFRLSPHLPSTRQLNRRLATNLVRNCLIGWLVLACIVMGFTAAMGASADKLVMQFCLCTLGLLFLCVPLLDYSNESRLRRGTLINWIAIAGVLVLLGLFLATGGASYLVAWIGFACLNVIAAIGFVAYRWRAMVAAPIAFPAGRIAC